MRPSAVIHLHDADLQLDKNDPNFRGAQALALLTAILELGAFVGALMAGPLADILSRKVCLPGAVGRTSPKGARLGNHP